MILDKEMLEYEENYFADKDDKVLKITEAAFAKMSTKEIEKYAYKNLFDFYYDEHTDGELDELLEELGRQQRAEEDDLYWKDPHKENEEIENG